MAAEKPMCRCCGKPLRKRTYSAEVPNGAPAPTEVNGRKVVAVVRRRTLAYRRMGEEKSPESVSVWCGTWGNYGDNFFCGLGCGYKFAVLFMRKSGGKRTS